MRIRVLLFAGLRERTGLAETELVDLGGEATVQDALDHLSRRWPFLEDYPLAVARNLEVVNRQTPLADGDEVALLPPVSGGTV